MEKLLLVFSLSVIVGQAYSCCMPQKLEGQIGMSIGLKNNGTPLAMTAFYDKWAMDTSIGRGYLSGTLYYGRYPTHQEVFQDYNLGKQYELSYGRCTVSPLLFDIKPVGGKYCMPPSDKIMASYKGLPNDTVDFDMYLIQFPGGQMTMSLTTKDCAPLTESIHTTEGVFNMGFMGLTEGITDPSVFEMPQACKDLQPSRKKRMNMATSIPICDICINNDISKTASGWCLECEEAICCDCEKHHRHMKLTKNHKIISIDDKKMSTSNLDSEQECNDHSRKLDFFCLKHSQPCCVTCIFEKHKKCQELKQLPEVEKGMTSFDSSFANLEDRVEDIIESITGLLKEKQENKTRLKVQKSNIITEVQTIRRSINSHFDKVQQSLIEGLEKEEKTQNERINICIEKLSAILKKVDKLSSKLEQAKQHKSEFQAFLAAFEWDKTIEKEEKAWISLQTDKISDSADIQLDLSPILKEFEKDLTEFGKIEVTYSPSKKLLLENPPNTGQSVTSASSAIYRINLTNICSFQTPSGTSRETLITDIDMLDDGRIILADNSSNRRLILMSQEGELIKIIQLNDICFGVAVIDKTTIATTLVKKKSIAIVDIDSSEVQQCISMSEECYGLSFAGETLVVSLDDPTFQFVNLSGKVVSSVWKADYADYCCVHNNKLYYATSSGDSVFEAKLNGDIVWKSYCQKYDFPDGITTDASGNVFVACKSSKKVIVFGKNGKESRVLLTKENGLNNPRAIHYKREMNILLVCNLSGQCFLYKVTN